MGRFWELLDTAAHALRLPWTGWICDRFDLSLGLTRDEISRTAPAFCQHLSYSGTPGLTCGQCGLPVAHAETSAAAAWPA